MVAIGGLIFRDQNAFVLFLACPLIVIGTDFQLFWRITIKHWKIIFLLPICLLFFHYLPLFFALSSAGLGRTSSVDPTGFVAAGRLFFVVLFSLSFIDDTDPRRLAEGLSRLGLPYRWAFVVYLGLRYVEVLRDTAQDIKDSIKLRMRGRRYGIFGRAQLFARFVFLLVVASLVKAEKTAIAMQSRGFGISPNRTFIRRHRWNVFGIILLGSMCFWLVFVLVH